MLPRAIESASIQNAQIWNAPSSGALTGLLIMPAQLSMYPSGED
jgi:hypothetical protein